MNHEYFPDFETDSSEEWKVRHDEVMNATRHQTKRNERTDLTYFGSIDALICSVGGR